MNERMGIPDEDIRLSSTSPLPLVVSLPPPPLVFRVWREEREERKEMGLEWWGKRRRADDEEEGEGEEWGGRRGWR